MSNNGKPTAANELILWDGTKFYSGKVTNSNIDTSATIDGSKITQSTSSDYGTILLTNDLSGSASLPTVVKINGNAVKLETLTSSQDGYVLTWNNSDGYWEAQVSSGGTLAGDAVGPAGSNTVQKIRNNTVAAGTPLDGYTLVWNALTSQWTPKNLGGYITVTNSNISATGVALQAGSISSSSSTLTLSSSSGNGRFAPGDVGKTIQIVAAGTIGADLYTTIA